MNRRTFIRMAALPALYPLRGEAQARRTVLTIKGDTFVINGRPTYQTRSGRRLLVSTSFGGTNSRTPREHPDTPVSAGVAKVSDYLLIHGNGPNDPALIKRCIAATRELGGNRSVPVMINEDPNFHFTEPTNHLLASVDEYTSWGYYEQGQSNYQDGFQSPPVNWTINTDNKRQFFELVKKVTGV
jgi:hypothetical protein